MNNVTTRDLRPANENPWYCLATVHGEHAADQIDTGLASKNSAFWSQWVNTDPRDQSLVAALRVVFARRTSLPLPLPGTIPDFSSTRFDNKVDFTGYHFLLGAEFKSAVFARGIRSARALFFRKADFTSAIFSEYADFSFATFSQIADFTSATFSKYADFEATTFDTIANFPSVVFSDSADFSSARFAGPVYFSSVIFSEGADFGAATFSSLADFNAATFFSFNNFINTRFAENAIFANARFENKVPDFRGATMHEATEWHGAAWPKPPRNKVDAQTQVYAYERLKQEMERLKKHEDEQHFFRRELRARRGLVRVLSGSWLLNFAYQASSAYGLSIGRPVLWLSAVFLGGTAIFSRAPLFCGAPMPLKLAAKVSFANIMVFLPINREIMTNANMIQCLSNTTQAVSAVQSMLGVVLLFLLGLSLRNRFRMK